MDDLISRRAVIDEANTWLLDCFKVQKQDRSCGLIRRIEDLPSAQPENCEGCKHLDKWENEVEYGYPSPCTCCKRRAEDHYER